MINNYYWEDIENLPQLLDKTIYFNEKKFLAPNLAGDIAFHNYSLNPDDTTQINRGWIVTSDNKKIWRYNGKYYQDDGEQVIRGIVQHILKHQSTDHRKNEVVSWIKDNAQLQIDRKTLDANPSLIGFDNGILDIDTMQFYDSLPDAFITSILPIVYDKKAKCPTWEKFLQDVMYLKDILFIQEFIGYCLYKRYIWAILVILVGFGRNGKSTFINTMTRLLGEQNVSQLPLQYLAHNEYAKAQLYRKWANFCADIGSEDIKKTGILKQLTGGDYIYARNIYEGPFTFVNYAKLLFGCNTLPTCNDNSAAMKERWAVIEFPNTFKRGTPECDPFIGDKLATELSGIFNWALEGLQRLLKNKTFSEYRNFEDVAKYQLESKNPVKMFVDSHVRSKVGAVLTKEIVYNAFLKFAKDNKHPTMYSNHFSSLFKQYAPHSLDEAQLREQQRKRCWLNIELVDISVESEQATGDNMTLDIQQIEQQKEQQVPTDRSGTDVTH